MRDSCYQIDPTAVQVPAAWDGTPAFEPTPEDVAEVAATFAEMARDAASEAVGAALAAVAEVLAASGDPLLGEHFDEWAMAELDALDPADRLEATATDFEEPALAEAGVVVRTGGGAA